ncbi:hypothetical protein A2U01_0051304, partial [Trifolium medium]|nr:hypothetical protein [Trifolium medium]
DLYKTNMHAKLQSTTMENLEMVGLKGGEEQDERERG